MTGGEAPYRRRRRAMIGPREPGELRGPGNNVERGIDAPMGPRDVRLFKAIFVLAVVVIVALGVLAWRG